MLASDGSDPRDRAGRDNAAKENEMYREARV